ncbi:MAG: hypothetical protein J4203_06780 [Candidatus Diapherotrites archaeon]|uniref:Uncharacterized protein n=1 Tax=Candidatus Iainarchaeum sp. TaxID=3101447 RepID=A0A8T4L8F7_9ARCH|nr:hypothetical protein [Candidatus Diapherotrites archaeon]
MARRTVAGLFRGRKPRALWGGAGKSARARYKTGRGNMQARSVRHSPRAKGVNVALAYRELMALEELEKTGVSPKKYDINGAGLSTTRPPSKRHVRALRAMRSGGTHWVVEHILGPIGRKRFRRLASELPGLKWEEEHEQRDWSKIFPRRGTPRWEHAKEWAGRIVEEATELKKELDENFTAFAIAIYELPDARRYREVKDNFWGTRTEEEERTRRINAITHHSRRHVGFLNGSLTVLIEEAGKWAASR